MTRLFDRRLIVVTGKGGVGRTTTACAIAVAAAQAGKRVCIAELAGLARVPEVFGKQGRSYAPREMAPGVDTISLSALDCMDDFGTRRLKVQALVRLVFHNRLTGAFLDAVPGLPDMQQLGKIRHLIEEPAPHDPSYDLIVLDAPATGHGLTLLDAARSLGEMTRVGPFYEETQLIVQLLTDAERTAILLVTLGEELPVNESLDLVEGLGEDRARLTAVIANQVRRRPLPPAPPWSEVRDWLRDQPELSDLADHAHQTWMAQERALSRLATAVDLPVARLPRLERVDLDGLAVLGAEVEGL
ncbi:MAG: hypothetical protein EP330_00525 [Deltaproteobacteria bacterium]|nr:MAG: hypothetical protein EP330_00525 [Deltaproteobacteria bacterium]